MKKLISEEKRHHSSQLVPYSYYKSMIPEYFSNVPLHWHNEFEINYILKGYGEFICGDERFIASKGEIIIIPPNILHAIHPFDKHEMIYDTIVFSGDMLGVSNNDRSTIQFIRPIINGNFNVNMQIKKTHHYYDELKTITENIFSSAKGNTPKLDLLIKSELMRLFWLLENNSDIHSTHQYESNRSDIIRPALEYINENFREDITTQQLAHIVHLSKSYFMHRFKETAGVSPIEYVIQIRIKFSCELLIHSDKTITEIAFECGFRNISNFNKQFKKNVGCTPIVYRKMKL